MDDTLDVRGVGDEADDDEAYERRRQERRRRHEAQRAAEQLKRQNRMRLVRRTGIMAASIGVCAIVIAAVSIEGNRMRQDRIAAEAEASAKEEAVAVDALLVEGQLSADELMVDGGDDSGADTISEAAALGLGVSGTSEVLSANVTDDTVGFWDDIVSTHGVLIDVDNEEILAQRGAYERINPASMTKILTVLVAAENVTDLDDTFTMTIDITDYSYVNDCSNVGYEVGETMTVRDLFYGTVLPSGGDAAVALATYVAGSHEAFVELMNEKLAELGLSETTHFTNCVGIYDEDHYSTAYDMAVILKAAVDNPWCKEVLSTHVYTTGSSVEHPEGMVLSNWFLRRIEDKDTHANVLCAKTGYVTQSGNCAASFAEGSDGKQYICVTAGASSVWRCIYDQTDLYSHFIEE
jgi:D-alanyl-D-alanine carboxypeptidase (penicillin-binding protein 5/6)